MARRKSAIDHLNNGRAPHIVHMIPPGAPGYAEAKGGAMVVSSPAEERRAAGVPAEELTPWWRVLRKGGFLNPKMPGGAERQAALLKAEGVRASALRKQLAVFDYEARRPDRDIEEDGNASNDS